ncbi:hypothetical protein [Anaerocolumna chitinilytica]|uniref:Uncharacterized protein n=1 Tax=Anaerocolumna chitinilytica TaxID=1727145 RepID=A0A7I8DL27_9FIRM|nr:hypothetical protein [Anaerocolumna chitinilytica]BCJ99079.1 hypothetical protein bsdcttw_21200 [Anaerocolumna chitinilytica]
MSKITEFIEHLPKQTPETVKECLGLLFRDTESIRSASVELAARGMLGMLPFAMSGRLPFALKPPNEQYALRILPTVPLEKAAVVICFEGISQARTIAPRISDFGAGALAFSRVRGNILTKEIKEELTDFAKVWGDTSNTRAILEVYSPEVWDENMLLRACVRTEYFEVFGELLEEDKSCLLEKTQRLMEKYPDNKILISTYADRCIRSAAGVDVSEMVWKMIKEDIICDSYIVMRSSSSWIPMKNAIRWLIKSGDNSCSKEYPLLYEAAAAWAQSDTYNGEIHLAFAKEIAEENPLLAYTQASNAAAIYTAREQKAPVEAIAFAEELAVKNQWTELSEVLGWAREELENGTIGTSN